MRGSSLHTRTHALSKLYTCKYAQLCICIHSCMRAAMQVFMPVSAFRPLCVLYVTLRHCYHGVFVCSCLRVCLRALACACGCHGHTHPSAHHTCTHEHTRTCTRTATVFLALTAALVRLHTHAGRSFQCPAGNHAAEMLSHLEYRLVNGHDELRTAMQKIKVGLLHATKRCINAEPSFCWQVSGPSVVFASMGGALRADLLKIAIEMELVGSSPQAAGAAWFLLGMPLEYGGQTGNWQHPSFHSYFHPYFHAS